MKPWLKWTIIVLGSIVLIIIIILQIAPGYIHKYVEANDLELIGREIFIEDLDFSWLSGQCEITGFDMREKDTSVSFLSYDRLFIDLNLWGLTKGYIHVKELQIEAPRVHIYQNGLEFNFSDLIPMEDTVHNESGDKTKSQWHFALENYMLSDGFILYQSELQPELRIDSFEVSVPMASDTSSIIDSHIQFHIETGGLFEIDNQIRQKESRFVSTVKMEDFDFAFLEPFLKAYLEINELNGVIDMNLVARGNWAKRNDVHLHGAIDIRDVMLIDKYNEELVALDQMHMDLDSFDLGTAEFDLGDLIVNGFSAKYEVFVNDEGEPTDSYTRITLPLASAEGPDTLRSGEAVNFNNPFSIAAAYVEVFAQQYRDADYKLNHFEVSNSSFTYNDYSLRDAFRYEISNMSLGAEGINSHAEYLQVNASATLNQVGRFEGIIRSYTDNLRNMDIEYKVYGTQLSPFTPYSNAYVAHAITEGEVVYENSTSIRDREIVSSNVIILDDFNFGKKSDHESVYNLPVRLAVGLLKDKDGNIVLDVPIEGDLDDPEYDYSRAIWTSIKNIVVNIVKAPFRFIGGMFGIEEENLKQVNFGLLQLRLDNRHEKQLNDMAKILEERPDLNIEFCRTTRKFETMERYAVTEVGHLFLYGTPIDEDLPKNEFRAVNEMDIYDSAFVAFVNERIPLEKQHLPIQSKCMLYVGQTRAEAQSDRIGYLRTNAIKSYLFEKKGIDSNRIRFKILHEDSLSTSRSTSIYSVGFWVNE